MNRLVDWIMPILMIAPTQLAFGNYAEGRFAWVVELVEKFASPIPARGNRRIWTWDRFAGSDGAA